MRPRRSSKTDVVESFHSRLRDECLAREWLASLAARRRESFAYLLEHVLELGPVGVFVAGLWAFRQRPMPSL